MVDELIDRLRAAFPEAHRQIIHGSPYQELMVAVLDAWGEEFDMVLQFDGEFVKKLVQRLSNTDPGDWPATLECAKVDYALENVERARRSLEQWRTSIADHNCSTDDVHDSESLNADRDRALYDVSAIVFDPWYSAWNTELERLLHEHDATISST